MTAQLTIGSARRVTIGRIAALQAGPEAGQPVLLVPGYTGSKEDFGPLLDPLAAQGLRVTAIDLPGHTSPRRCIPRPITHPTDSPARSRPSSIISRAGCTCSGTPSAAWWHVLRS